MKCPNEGVELALLHHLIQLASLFTYLFFSMITMYSNSSLTTLEQFVSSTLIIISGLSPIEITSRRRHVYKIRENLHGLIVKLDKVWGQKTQNIKFSQQDKEEGKDNEEKENEGFEMICLKSGYIAVTKNITTRKKSMQISRNMCSFLIDKLAATP